MKWKLLSRVSQDLVRTGEKIAATRTRNVRNDAFHFVIVA